MRFGQLTRLAILAYGYAVSAGGAAATAAPTGNPAFTDPAQADADFRVQGEYAGEVRIDGRPLPLGVHVIALGDGTFDFVVYPGGLPGAGWNATDRIRGTGVRKGDAAPVELEAVDRQRGRAAAEDRAEEPHARPEAARRSDRDFRRHEPRRNRPRGREGGTPE